VPNIVTVTCRNCGQLPLIERPEDGLCPTCCAPVNTHTSVALEETLRTFDSTQIKFKGRDGRRFTASSGYVLDRNTNTIARFWQLVDKNARRYAKIVVLRGGFIKKHQDGSLADQNLHHRQSTPLPPGPVRNLEQIDKIGPEFRQ
jgi:hypothetical protein